MAKSPKQTSIADDVPELAGLVSLLTEINPPASNLDQSTPPAITHSSDSHITVATSESRLVGDVYHRDTTVVADCSSIEESASLEEPNVETSAVISIAAIDQTTSTLNGSNALEQASEQLAVEHGEISVKATNTPTDNPDAELSGTLSSASTSDRQAISPKPVSPHPVSPQRAAPTTQASVSDSDRPDTLHALQGLLVGPELAALQAQDQQFTQQLTAIQQQLQHPEHLAQLIKPVIAEALQQRMQRSEDDIIPIISAVLEQIIHDRAQQPDQQLGEALAPAISPAISTRIADADTEVADAVAPIMGQALQKQIDLDDSAVVDALYPIIGGTISKYLNETLQQINQQIEHTFSVQGISRKVRAKIQGVSEAELILKEAVPFQVQAIFLIHKMSGLVIAESQPDEADARLESEMMAGMLTAIRSFANDCMTQGQNVADLNILDYGMSKVLLEVTGSSYLAIVLRGEIPKVFIQTLRHRTGQLIQLHGTAIAKFEGDPETVPTAITTVLDELRSFGSGVAEEAQQTKNPLLWIGVGLISSVILPWGGWQYLQHRHRSIEAMAHQALIAAPELSVYNLEVQANWYNRLQINGRVPRQRLKQQAKALIQQKLPQWQIDNQIHTVQVPVAPELIQAELQRLTRLLNQRPDIQLKTAHHNHHITIDGQVGTSQAANQVTQSISAIPGIQTVTNRVQVRQSHLETRIYFDYASATAKTAEIKRKLPRVINFLRQNPDRTLIIVGHSKTTGSEIGSAQLALDRANTVRQALLRQGIAPQRLQIKASTYLPPGIHVTEQNTWLSRCVLFEISVESSSGT